MDWWTLGLQAVNFLVLVALLQRFLYRPVLTVIVRRQTEMDKLSAAAYEAKVKAQQAEADWRRREEEEEGRRLELHRQALIEARASAEDIMAQARRDAQELLAQSRAALATEREAVTGDIKNEAAALATDLARQLLSRVAPNLSADGFLDMLERHLGALSEDQRRAIAGGHALTLECSTALPPDLRQSWQSRLGALTGAPGVSFREQPELIAGVRLIGSGMTVEISLAAALADAQREMAGNAAPG